METKPPLPQGKPPETLPRLAGQLSRELLRFCETNPIAAKQHRTRSAAATYRLVIGTKKWPTLGICATVLSVSLIIYSAVQPLNDKLR